MIKRMSMVKAITLIHSPGIAIHHEFDHSVFRRKFRRVLPGEETVVEEEAVKSSGENDGETKLSQIQIH